MRFRASNLLLLCGIVAAIAAALVFTDRAQRNTGNESYSENTANQAVQNAMWRLVEGTEGYVSLGHPRALGQYEGAQLRVERSVTSLRDIANSGQEKAAVDQMAKLIRAQQSLDARAVHQRQATGQPGSVADQQHRISVFDQVIAANKNLSTVIDEERRSAQTRTTLVSLGAIGVLGLLIVALGLSARRTDRRRRRIRRFGEGLQAARTEPEAYSLVQAHLERSVPGSEVSVFNRNNSADRLEPTTPVDENSDLGKALEGAKPDDCLAVRTAKASTGGTGEDDLLRCDICGKIGGRSLCVPAIVGGEVIGSVLVRGQKSFADSTERTVSESVGEAAPVVAHLRNLAIAERRAASDKLTGLPNKRSADDTFKHMVANAARTSKSLALVLLDLDHFKRVNDTHGHPKGDEVLAAIGSTVGHTIRENDFAARDGGEEFMVLLPGDDTNDGRLVAEKLRSAISSLRIPDLEQGITASFGVASFPDDAATREELVRKADRALYSAKRAGRNRVHTAADPESDEEPAQTENGAAATVKAKSTEA